MSCNSDLCSWMLAATLVCKKERKYLKFSVRAHFHMWTVYGISCTTEIGGSMNPGFSKIASAYRPSRTLAPHAQRQQVRHGANLILLCEQAKADVTGAWWWCRHCRCEQLECHEICGTKRYDLPAEEGLAERENDRKRIRRLGRAINDEERRRTPEHFVPDLL